MRILTTTVGEMTAKEYKTCSNLTMRDHGMMMYSLRDVRRNCPDSIALLVLEGNDIVGWALLIPTKYDTDDWNSKVYLTPYARKTAKYYVQFYIKTTHRRQGIGRVLMDEVLFYSPRPFVFPWSDESAALFADYPVLVESYRRRYLAEARRKKRGKV